MTGVSSNHHIKSKNSQTRH